jgi:microcystin degradation protein MlrC
MRVGLSALILETNSFSPQKSDLRYFKENGFLLAGDEIVPYHHHVRNEVAGFLDTCTTLGLEVYPVCAAWAVPHGPLTRITYRKIKHTILTGFIEELPRLDAFYLALHGSMVVEGLDDPEGDLMAAVRRVIGTKPLVVSLDFHGNITQAMVRHPDIIIGYNSYPHNNMYEIGEKSARLLSQYWDQIPQLCRLYVKLPMVTPLERMTIDDNPPMRRLIERCDEIEKETGIVSVNVFGVQPWIDVPELGSSIVLVAHRDHLEKAQAYCVKLAQDFWKARHYLQAVVQYSPEEAVKQALASGIAPVLLNEPADNVGSGATGDSVSLLRVLADVEPPVPTILTVCDSKAVDRCHRSKVGQSVELVVGGQYNPWETPMRISGVLRSLSDGVYRFRGPVQTGVTTSMGRAAVLEFKPGMYLQITELPPYTIDPEHYRCMGLMPERMKLVGIKSQGSYKASYNSIPHLMLFVDSPGLSRSDTTKVPYTKVDTSHLYPFNLKVRFKARPIMFMNNSEVNHE